MIKGLLIIRAQPLPPADEEDAGEVELKWQQIAAYVPIKEEKPTEEILEAIIGRLLSNPDAEFLNYRHFPYKYYAKAITAEEEAPNYYCVYVLESAESLEIVRISEKGVLDSIEELLKKPKPLTALLEKIFSGKNNLLDKLSQSDILQAEIGGRANKLIDDGQFEKAQDIIKLAKEIPPKIIENYKKYSSNIKMKEFRKAESGLDKCLDLAEKIDDRELQLYLRLKIKNTKQIPAFTKELSKIFTGIVKSFSKSPTYLPYSGQGSKLRRAINLLEKLEQDTQIERTVELEGLIVKAAKELQILKDFDTRIKRIVKELI